MIVIGLTGGIGTGKSTVAQMLQELGAVIINVDQVARELTKPGSRLLAEIVNKFGPEYLDVSGNLKRKKLANLVFNDREALALLNSIAHPLLKKEVAERLRAFRSSPCPPAVVVEAAVLFEMEAPELMDEVWVTYAPRELQMQRLRQRDGLTSEEASARVASQRSADEFLSEADAVIDTGTTLEETCHQVAQLWSRRVVLKESAQNLRKN